MNILLMRAWAVNWHIILLGFFLIHLGREKERRERERDNYYYYLGYSYFGDPHISLQAVPRDNMRRVRAEKGRAIH